MKSTVLDSYAIITFLQRQKGYEIVAKIFDESVSRDREIFLCVINWGEVIYHALRNGGEKRAILAEDAMRALPIHLIEANRELTLQAARYKAVHKMSFADCFAAALAKRLKADLLTGDREFLQVEKEIKIHWIR